MPLLILPLIILVVLALWLLLLPVALWQRYRVGRARRRAWPWLVRVNGVLLPISAVLFLAAMAVTGLWWPGALAYAAAGVAAGLLVGLLGLALARFEHTPQGLFYTPNAWLILALTLLVAARIAMGAVELWRHWQGRDALALLPVLDHATLFSVAGLLIGYYLVFNLGLRRRLRGGPARRP
jgi:uncharacterized membrane protein YidH (DUF202 family)